MAVKTDCTSTVKAYEFGNSIVVKYYDTGDAGTVSCPLCHWLGPLEIAARKQPPGSSEFRCPDCNTKLAKVTPANSARKC